MSEVNKHCVKCGSEIFDSTSAFCSRECKREYFEEVIKDGYRVEDYFCK